MKLLHVLTLMGILSLYSCGYAQKQNEKAMAEQKEKFPLEKTEEQWKKELTDEEYYVLREKGTERAFTGKYWDVKEDGTYVCAACNNPLFKSNTKFESGTGWPSFYEPISEGSVIEIEDRSHGMVRTEVVCGNCGGHLGHVFTDGPKPTGMRYCINSVSLDLEKDKK